MLKFEVILTRAEYFSQSFKIEANSAEEAQEIAWDRSGNWRFVDADEETYQIKEMENA
jgi:hypothetical protein